MKPIRDIPRYCVMNSFLKSFNWNPKTFSVALSLSTSVKPKPRPFMLGKNCTKNRKKVDINYLLNFNSCFYCVFTVSHFDSVGFTFFELFDNFFV